jgi:hypothetical protein
MRGRASEHPEIERHESAKRWRLLRQARPMTQASLIKTSRPQSRYLETGTKRHRNFQILCQQAPPHALQTLPAPQFQLSGPASGRRDRRASVAPSEKQSDLLFERCQRPEIRSGTRLQARGDLGYLLPGIDLDQEGRCLSAMQRPLGEQQNL